MDAGNLLVYKTPSGAVYKELDIKLNCSNNKTWPFKCRQEYPNGDSPLQHACRTNQNEIVLFFLKTMKSYVFTSPPKNKNEETIIHLACENGDPRIIRKVADLCGISEGMVAKNKNGMTPLAILVEKTNRAGIAAFLLEIRATLILQPSEPKDPLFIASNHQEKDILRMIIGFKKSNYDSGPNFNVTLSQHPDLKKESEEEETKHLIKYFNKNERDEARYLAAICANQPELLRVILPNPYLKPNLNLLIATLRNRNSSTLKVLLDHQVTFQQFKGVQLSVVNSLVIWGDLELLKQMVDLYNPELNHYDETGNTPVTKLCKEMIRNPARQLALDFQLLDFLISKGVVLQKPDKKGNTVYKLAADAEHASLQEYLRGVQNKSSSAVSQKLDYRSEYDNLFSAAKSGSETSFLRELQKIKETDFSAIDAEGYTLLHRALENRDMRIAVLLMLEGADTEIQALDGTTVLEHAARQEKKPFIERMLKLRAIDFNSSQGSSLLEDQLSRGQDVNSQELAYYMYRRGAKPTQQCYLLAVKNQFFRIATEMLKSGVIPIPGSLPKLNQREFIEGWLEKIEDPSERFYEALKQDIKVLDCYKLLHQSSVSLSAKIVAACLAGALSQLKELLQRRLIPISSHQIAIVWPLACSQTSREMIQSLFDAGLVKLTEVDDEGDTALHYAAQNRSRDVLDYLISSKKLNVDCRNNAGLSPLDILIQDTNHSSANIGSVAVLLEAKADCSDSDSLLVLWRRAQKAYSTACKDLIFDRAPKVIFFEAISSSAVSDLERSFPKYARTLSFTSEERNWVVKRVCSNDSPEVLDVLINNKFIDPMTFTVEGDHLLHLLTDYNSTKILSSLLSRYSLDVNMRNVNGVTALEIVFQRPIFTICSITRLLFQKGARIGNEGIREKLWIAACQINDTAFAKEFLHSEGPAPLAGEGVSSPLHIAASANSFDILRYLIELNKWNINQVNHKSETALFQLCQSSLWTTDKAAFKEMLELFIRHGAHCKITKYNGEGPFVAFLSVVWNDFIKDFEESWGRRSNFSRQSPGILVKFTSDKKEACRERWNHYSLQPLLDLFIQGGADKQPALKFFQEVKWKERVTSSHSGIYTTSYDTTKFSGPYKVTTTHTTTHYGPGFTTEDDCTSPIKEIATDTYNYLKKV